MRGRCGRFWSQSQQSVFFMYEQSVTIKLLVYADDIQLHCFLIMDLKFFKVILPLGSTSRIWFSKIGFFINKIKLINTFELH